MNTYRELEVMELGIINLISKSLEQNKDDWWYNSNALYEGVDNLWNYDINTVCFRNKNSNMGYSIVAGDISGVSYLIEDVYGVIGKSYENCIEYQKQKMIDKENKAKFKELKNIDCFIEKVAKTLS